jgi:hypothetical protein
MLARLEEYLRVKARSLSVFMLCKIEIRIISCS